MIVLQIFAGLVVVFILWLAYQTFWTSRRMRPSEDGFEFVRVNSDKSVRELSPEEKEYLSEEFSGGDGGRPYIKSNFEDLDGWNSFAGFIKRSLVPQEINIVEVHPDYDERSKEIDFDMVTEGEEVGDIITHNKDGSVSISPNPNIDPEERIERYNALQLKKAAELEQLAKYENK